LSEAGLARARAAFAEDLRSRSALRSDALVRAFASVPRERFLGPGPWRILLPERLADPYQTTPDADPVRLYRNVLVALDEQRGLNNGEPAALARWFDALDLAQGETVLHVGCGVGYYTAILAEVVGPSGRVIGVEADAELSARARTHLAAWPQVSALHGDGSRLEPGAVDAVFVNAGATHPMAVWLDALRPGGRLVFPLTIDVPDRNAGFGAMLRVARDGARYAVSSLGPVGVYHCHGARDASMERALRKAFAAGGLDRVTRLRRDPHPPAPDCWLHGTDACFASDA
jgi:protein-L-isoaspartate(D-aspartate) O-methyltransferase